MNPSPFRTRPGAVLLAGLSLAACATAPPGEDAKGQELKAQATPVLVALVNYRKDRGEYPSSLYELVPKYLKEIPFGANLNLISEKKLVEFDYTLPWPRTSAVTCIALLGQVEWRCQE